MHNLRSLKIGEHNKIGDIIGDSFSDDPVNLWVFGCEPAMKFHYAAVARKLFLPKGFGHIMNDETGGTLWLPPNAKKHIPLLNSVDIATSMIKHNGLGSIFRGLGVDDALAKAKPTQAHYYLFAIGSRVNHQGKGIGSQLMSAGLERVDAEKMPAYLESSKAQNVPFYNKFGFEVVKKITPKQGCPPLWLMWREAKS